MNKMIANLKSKFSDETIGSIQGNENKKENKQKKTEKTNKFFGKNKIIKEKEENISASYNSNVDSTPFNTDHTVLEYLNIPATREVNVKLNSSYISDLKFTTTAPTGYCEEEVKNFCDDVEEAIHKYENALYVRNYDFSVLLKEFTRLEKELMQVKNESELAIAVAANREEEDYLRNKLITVQNEKQDLIQKIIELENKIEELTNSTDVDTEIHDIKPSLPKRTENIRKQTKNVEVKSVGLKALSQRKTKNTQHNNTNLISEMLESIGGIEDE